MEWKGLAARFHSIFYIRCALTGTWNGRSVNCPGLLLRPAARPRLCLRRVVSAFPDISSEALACGGVGCGNSMNAAEGFPTRGPGVLY